MALSKPLQGPNIVLCEGRHDQSFIVNLLRANGVSGYEVLIPNEVDDRGGHTLFKDALVGYRTDSGFPNVQGIVVVRDADTDPVKAFGETQDAIRDAGAPYLVPTGIRERTRGIPGIGILLIPRDDEVGNLETLLLKAVKDKVLLKNLQSAEIYLANTGASRWSITKQSKAKIRSLIAGSHQSDPDLGVAKIWSDFPHFASLRDRAFQEVLRYLRQFPTMLPT